MDKLSPTRRSRNMSAIRSKGMKPELLVRRLVHRLGYRYRLHQGNLPGKPDLVFPARGKVIFVHGCFWHQHPSHSCKIVRVPKSNLTYWADKLRKNVLRDKKNTKKLKISGWQVLVLWECATRDENALKEEICSFLGDHCGGTQVTYGTPRTSTF